MSDAFNYGWRKFQQNLGPWILGVLILFVGLFLIQIVYQIVVGALFSTSVTVDPVTGEVSGGSFFGLMISSFILSIPITILGIVVSAQLVRGALATVDGGRIELGTFFQTSFLGPVILAAIIAGFLVSLGLFAFFIGALVVAFFVQFYAYFVLGEGRGPWQAITLSFGFVNRNIANVFVLGLASMVAAFIGALLCGIGLLVAWPVILIAQAYTFRVLRGEPVAP